MFAYRILKSLFANMLKRTIQPTRPNKSIGDKAKRRLLLDILEERNAPSVSTLEMPHWLPPSSNAAPAGPDNVRVVTTTNLHGTMEISYGSFSTASNGSASSMGVGHGQGSTSQSASASHSASGSASTNGSTSASSITVIGNGSTKIIGVGHGQGSASGSGFRQRLG